MCQIFLKAVCQRVWKKGLSKQAYIKLCMKQLGFIVTNVTFGQHSIAMLRYTKTLYMKEMRNIPATNVNIE